MSLELCHTTMRLLSDTAMFGECDSSIPSLIFLTGSKLKLRKEIPYSKGKGAKDYHIRRPQRLSDFLRGS
jgi:hypothetical protein